jgi:hypothetical protein
MTELELRLEDLNTSITAEDLAGVARDFDNAAGPLRAFAGE